MRELGFEEEFERVVAYLKEKHSNRPAFLDEMEALEASCPQHDPKGASYGGIRGCHYRDSRRRPDGSPAPPGPGVGFGRRTQ